MHLVSICLLWPAFASGAEPRYGATLRDGTTAAADEVRDWHGGNAQPQVGGHLVFDSQNPMRWLRDTSLAPATLPSEFLEFVGGDRFPGRVVGYRRGAESEVEVLPPHLLAEPRTPLDLAGMEPRPHLRMATEWLRRVVWESLGDQPYRPGTVFLRGGRQVGFRALNWTDTGIKLLLEEGTSTLAFTEIAELHLPARDNWQAHLSRLAVLTPELNSTLIHVSAADGAELTTSRARYLARSTGSNSDPKNWVHALQPAWSLDTLFVPHRQIRQRTFFGPTELPLTWCEPSASRHRPILSTAWGRWRLNASVQNTPLINAGKPGAWGFGVQAQHELEFLLPLCATTFHTRMGIDARAGTGGCAQGRVHIGGADEKPVFESPVLVGSTLRSETGPLRIGAPPPGGARLLLVADAVTQNRPPHADPLDIRDMFDWLEPLVELDAERLRIELRDVAPRALGALEGWTLDGKSGLDWRLVNHDDTRSRRTPAFRLLLLPLGALSLTRSLRVPEERTQLSVLASRPDQGTSASQLEILVDGVRVGSIPLPVRRLDQPPQPIYVKLNEFRGREIRLELKFAPTDERSLVDFRGVTFIAEPSPR